METDLNNRTGFVEEKFTEIISKIFVVRHGESVANTEGIYQGQTYDTDLSDLGKKQAKLLSKRARDLGVKRIVSSPLKRTYQTALEISKELDLPVEINSLIIETNHGAWEGKDKNFIETNFSEIYKRWRERPGETLFPGGESFFDTFKRVEYFIESANLENGTIIVTHDNIVRILASMADGVKLNEIWNYEVEPTALNFFEINVVNGKNKLKRLKLNDKDHLKGFETNLINHAL